MRTLAMLWLLFMVTSAIADDYANHILKHSPAFKLSEEKQLEKIKTEITSSPKHKWAGDYFAGDGLGFNLALTVAPESGFVYSRSGCTGVYDRNFGTIRETSTHIQLDFAAPNDENTSGVGAEMTLISWGQRSYLIPRGELTKFCNSVNSGYEPRTSQNGAHLLKKGSENIEVSGPPDLPEEYSSLLLKLPLQARIVAAMPSLTTKRGEDFVQIDTTIRLESKGEAKFFEGMRLFVTKPERRSDEVKVYKVDRYSAYGTLTQYKFGRKTLPSGPVGWELSSKALPPVIPRK